MSNIKIDWKAVFGTVCIHSVLLLAMYGLSTWCKLNYEHVVIFYGLSFAVFETYETLKDEE